MAQAEGECYINELLDELFLKIMDLVPITDVFVDMRVSKRWEDVCRQAVGTRKSLIIGDVFRFKKYDDPVVMQAWKWRKNQPSQQLDTIIGAHDSLVPMMKSVEQMKNVKRLCVSEISSQNVREFIRKLAGKLTFLAVDFAISDISAYTVFPRLTHLYCRHFDAEAASAFPKLAELLILWKKGREKLPNIVMPSLKSLLCVGCSDNKLIRPFILSNCENLEKLHADGFRLRFVPAVVFKNMTELDIYSINVDMVKSLPAIRRLELEEGATVAVLDRLPAAQMLSLHVEFDFDPVAHHDEEDDEKHGPEEFAAVISRMSNLKELSIFDRQKSRNANKDPYPALSSIFDKVHQLQKVCIMTDHARFSHSGLNGDRVMFALAQQNPNLSNVLFRGIEFTSAAFASLAQLRHMSRITLEPFSASVNVRIRRKLTDNILTLLRGSSRNVIRKFRVWKEGLNIAQISHEVELMAEERGSTVEKYEDRCLLVFRILA